MSGSKKICLFHDTVLDQETNESISRWLSKSILTIAS